MSIIRPIVIGSDHYNTLGLVRNLGEAGYSPILILVDDNDTPGSSFVASSKYLLQTIIVKSEDKIVDVLCSLPVISGISVLFPSGDGVASIIDRQSDRLPIGFITHNIEGVPGQLSEASNKEKMRQRAETFGFSTPSTWMITKGETIPEDVEYPCLIKGINSSISGKDDVIYSTPETLKNGLSKLFERCDTIQIQRFIKKDIEIIFLGWSIDGQVAIPCVMEKLREYPEKFGCTGLGYFHADVSRWFPIEQLSEMMSSYRYTGLFSVEFLVSDGLVFFLEINFRNDGNGYFPAIGGVNLVERYIEGLVNAKKPDMNERIDHSFYMMREHVDIKYVISTKYPLIKWLGEIRRAEVFQIWNRKDINPFVRLIKNKLFKRFNRARMIFCKS